MFLYRSRFPLPDIYFGGFMSILEPIIILTGLMVVKGFRFMWTYSVIVLSVLFFVCLHANFAVYISSTFSHSYIWLPQLRFLLYASSTVVFGYFIYEERMFLYTLSAFSFFTLIGWIVYLINSNNFSIVEYTGKRFCFLFSEPSAIAPLTVFWLLFSFQKRSYLLMLLSAAALYVVDSGTGYLLLAIFMVRLGWNLIKRSVRSAFISIFAVVILGIMLKDHLLSTTAFEKILRLSLLNIKSGELGQSRLNNIVESMILISGDITYWIGTGLNSWKSLTNNEQSLRVFSFTHLLLVSFGLPFGLSLIALVIRKLARLRFNVPSELFILVFSLSSLVNSAQGLLMWKILILGVALSFKLKSSKRVRS